MVNQDWPAEVIVGVRPEDISLRPAGTGIPATIKLLEHLGSENIIFASVAEQMLTLKSDKETVVHLDENVGLEVAAGSLHFFDPDTEQRLEPVETSSQ